MKTKKIEITSALKQITAVTTLLMSTSVLANPYSAQQGLDKINTNLENAKYNEQDYSKNLNVVQNNLNEIGKSKSVAQKQKDSVSQEIVNNNESLKKVILQEKEIQILISQEQQKVDYEKKQLEQLEAMMNQIKQNQIQRQAIITDYQNQLNMTADEKKAWKVRESELRAQETKTIQSLRTIATDEAAWSSKKKGYETEVKRWGAEAEKQQKIYDTYQGLKENK